VANPKALGETCDGGECVWPLALGRSYVHTLAHLQDDLGGSGVMHLEADVDITTNITWILRFELVYSDRFGFNIRFPYRYVFRFIADLDLDLELAGSLAFIGAELDAGGDLFAMFEVTPPNNTESTADDGASAGRRRREVASQQLPSADGDTPRRHARGSCDIDPNELVMHLIEFAEGMLKTCIAFPGHTLFTDGCVDLVNAIVEAGLEEVCDMFQVFSEALIKMAEGGRNPPANKTKSGKPSEGFREWATNQWHAVLDAVHAFEKIMDTITKFKFPDSPSKYDCGLAFGEAAKGIALHKLECFAEELKKEKRDLVEAEDWFVTAEERAESQALAEEAVGDEVFAVVIEIFAPVIGAAVIEVAVPLFWVLEVAWWILHLSDLVDIFEDVYDAVLATDHIDWVSAGSALMDLLKFLLPPVSLISVRQGV